MIRKDATQEDAGNSDGPDDKGIECGRCGCRHFYVVYTRPGANNSIVRRRECRHCGRRLTTVEK